MWQCFVDSTVVGFCSTIDIQSKQEELIFMIVILNNESKWKTTVTIDIWQNKWKYTFYKINEF